MLQAVLEPKPSVVAAAGPDGPAVMPQPADFAGYLRDSFNAAQQRAIEAASAPDATGFTLIKGPPGTGKTATLMGVLNSIHVREYNRFYEASLACALEVMGGAEFGNDGATTAWHQMTQAKPRILVTAPSNVAVDQVCLSRSSPLPLSCHERLQHNSAVLPVSHQP